MKVMKDLERFFHEIVRGNSRPKPPLSQIRRILMKGLGDLGKNFGKIVRGSGFNVASNSCVGNIVSVSEALLHCLEPCVWCIGNNVSESEI